MTKTFYKSLDREFEIVGIKGRWVKTLLVAVGCIVAFGVLVGGIMGTGMALITILVGVVAAFFTCMILQAKIPSRRLDKAKIADKVPGWVVRRESLARIITEDPRYEEVRRLRLMER